jgi:hypothetical protein
MEKEFVALQTAEVAFYSNEIVAFVKKSGKVPLKKQAENLFKFVKTVPKEAASGFWAHFAKTTRVEALKWYESTPGVKDYLYGILSKKQATGE